VHSSIVGTRLARYYMQQSIYTRGRAGPPLWLTGTHPCLPTPMTRMPLNDPVPVAPRVRVRLDHVAGVCIDPHSNTY